jgi:hypothetical protein
MTRFTFRRSSVASKFWVVSARTVTPLAECRLRRAQEVAQSGTVLADCCSSSQSGQAAGREPSGGDNLAKTEGGAVKRVVAGSLPVTGDQPGLFAERSHRVSRSLPAGAGTGSLVRVADRGPAA